MSDEASFPHRIDISDPEDVEMSLRYVDWGEVTWGSGVKASVCPLCIALVMEKTSPNPTEDHIRYHVAVAASLRSARRS